MPFKIDTNTVFPITIPNASTTADGVMSAADKTKLDSLAGTIRWEQTQQTWAEIKAQADAIVAGGGIVTIYLIDDSGEGDPFVIDSPANFDNFYLVGLDAASLVTINFNSGAQITGTKLHIANAIVVNNVTVYPAGLPFNFSFDNVSAFPGGPGTPFVVLGPAASGQVILRNAASISDNSGPWATMDDGSSLVFNCGSQGSFIANAVAIDTAPHTANWIALLDSTCSYTGTPAAELNFNPILVGDANNLPYTNFSGDFAASPPLFNAAQALNRIAHAVFVLRGNVPIP